jgi:PAS domain S-box-containing protein
MTNNLLIFNDNELNISELKVPNYFLTFIIASILYFITARLSLFLAVGNTNVSPVWPPSGIALAAILVYGYRISPAIFLGAFFANIFSLKAISPIPVLYLSASFSTAIGNMLEGAIGAYLIKRFTGTRNPFENIKGLFIFITLGCLISTTISATIGVLSLDFITGNWPESYSLWITWWLGDATGIAVVSPVLLMLKNKMWLKYNWKKILEIVFVYLILISSAAFIFWKGYHLEYLIIPVLLWIAFRFGRFEATIAVFIVSAITIVSTINGAGPLTDLVLKKTLVYLLSFIGVIAIATLCLSILNYEHNKAEESRLAAQKQLYDIIDFLPDATFAIDKDGKVIAWNKAIEEMTGKSKKDMIGKGNYAYSVPFFGEAKPILIDIIMKPNNPSHLSIYDNINNQKTTIFAELYNPVLNHHLAGAASVLLDKEGNVYGAIESIRDISDRKIAELELKHYKENLEKIVKERSAALVQANDLLIGEIRERDHAEKALKESERKYRDLVESANSVILRWKPDGSITFFNAFAQKFFGFTEPEIIGKNVVGTIVPVLESSGRDLSVLMDDLEQNPEKHIFNENENIKKNGERVWIAWTNKPVFDESGAITEILSVGNDITIRRKIEESLLNTMNELAIAKEQAESADRIKSAFLATMSHELRTPLNSIIGFTGTILQGLAGPLNEEQNKQLNMVQNSSRHLLALIGDVLDISKIEAGQLELLPSQFQLKPAIEKIIKVILPMAEKKGLRIHLDIADDPGTIIADQRRLEQVILNLLNNAVKFTEKGHINVLNKIENGMCILSVEDTGIGMKPEDIPKLFQPFYQIDSGTARKNEGTGLGLSICKKILDLMNGSIDVQSKLGEGSTFTIQFPVIAEGNI